MQNGAEICGQTFVFRNSAPLMIDVNIKRLKQGLSRGRHAIALLKEQAGVEREGNLTVRLGPLHRPPHERQVEPFIWQRR